jgi:hypothetical protein
VTGWSILRPSAAATLGSSHYSAPYVFRVAISDRRIVSCDNGRATFSYRKSGTSRWRTMTVDALEFIRRFLQHVLPRGFQKVRHYGFLSASSRIHGQVNGMPALIVNPSEIMSAPKIVRRTRSISP